MKLKNIALLVLILNLAYSNIFSLTVGLLVDESSKVTQNGHLFMVSVKFIAMKPKIKEGKAYLEPIMNSPIPSSISLQSIAKFDADKIISAKEKGERLNLNDNIVCYVLSSSNRTNTSILNDAYKTYLKRKNREESELEKKMRLALEKKENDAAVQEAQNALVNLNSKL